MLADAEQIKRVLVNLIENAAKRLGTPTVRPDHYRDPRRYGARLVALVVSDNGPGIPARPRTDLRAVFLDAKARDRSGAGDREPNCRGASGPNSGLDNPPNGVRFILELPSAKEMESLG